MIKKLFYRWINPELQKRNEALIYQINKLVAEKHMILDEVNHHDEMISRYEAYVDTLESQVIFLKSVHSQDTRFLNWRIAHLELTVDRLLKTRSFSTDK